MNKIQYNENIQYFQYFQDEGYMICLFNDASMKACALWCETHARELEYTNKNVYYINYKGDIIRYGAIGQYHPFFEYYTLPILGIKIGNCYHTILGECENRVLWDENISLIEDEDYEDFMKH